MIKKNEKPNDLKGEEDKGKKAGSSSVIVNDCSMKISNETLNISGGDVSSQTSHLYNESGHSSPITSPSNALHMAEFEQASMEKNPSDIWISPDFILDSSKVLKIIFCRSERTNIESENGLIL